jgi:Icc-related predicted phosphoesterase
MRFIALGDIEKAEYVNELLKPDLSKYDFVLLTGDISGTPDGWKIGRARGMGDKSFIPAGKGPKEFYRELLQPFITKLKKIDHILGDIKTYTKVFGVWGNTDFNFVVKEAKSKNIEIVHNKVLNVDGFYLVGYNGHPMYPWEITEPDKKDIFGYTHAETAKELNSFTEEQIYADLTAATKNLPHHKVIVVTHTPPYKILDKVVPDLIPWAVESYGDRSKEGNVGSTGLRKFLLEFKPILSVFGHIHEAKGIEKIDGGTFINAGNFNEQLEFVDVEINDKDIKTKFEKLDK